MNINRIDLSEINKIVMVTLQKNLEKQIGQFVAEDYRTAAVFSKSLMNLTAFFTLFFMFLDNEIFPLPNFTETQLQKALISINKSYP